MNRYAVRVLSTSGEQIYCYHCAADQVPHVSYHAGEEYPGCIIQVEKENES